MVFINIGLLLWTYMGLAHTCYRTRQQSGTFS